MTSLARHFAFLAVLCASALPATAQVRVPVSGDAGIIVDMKTFREMTLNQRLWSLQDQKRRHEADLNKAGNDIQWRIGISYKEEDKIAAFGATSLAQIPEVIAKKSLAELEALRAQALEGGMFGTLNQVYSGMLHEATVARAQIDAIDTQIKEIQAQLAALK